MKLDLVGREESSKGARVPLACADSKEHRSNELEIRVGT